MKLFSCCCTNKVNNARNIVILLVGLDNAGKTTAVNGLTRKDIRNVLPTVGFSIVTLKHRGYDVMIYDLGGGPQIRDIWPKYFNDVHGVIFVIDASDSCRLEESRIVLENLLKHEKIAAKPVLILANKQDKTEALDELDITEKFCIEPLVNVQKCPTRVEISSVVSNGSKKQQIDQGLLNGYRWLLGQIIKNYVTLNSRVVRDSLKEKEEVDERRRLWKAARDSIETTDFNSTYERDFIIGDSSSSENIVCNGIKHQVVTEVHNPADIDSSRPPSVTSAIREQFERKGKKQRKKSFSARSRRNKIGPSPVHIISADELMGQFDLPQFMGTNHCRRSDHNRPLTTRSLGRQGTAWDLHKPLDIINLLTPDKVDKSTSIT